MLSPCRWAERTPASTVDGDRATFWRVAGTTGQPIVLAFRFHQPVTVSRISFVDDVQNRYALGALEIQIPQNSTDGIDGDWATVDTVPASFDAPAGEFTRAVTIASTRWVRLRMTPAQGKAANALSLSEVGFQGGTVEPASAAGAEVYRFSTDVLVTASRREQRTIDAPVSMTVIDRREIESSPAQNIADLLRGVPGLNVVEVSARDGASPAPADERLRAGQLYSWTAGRLSRSQRHCLLGHDAGPLRRARSDRSAARPRFVAVGRRCPDRGREHAHQSPQGDAWRPVHGVARRTGDAVDWRTMGRRARGVELQALRQLLPAGSVERPANAAVRVADAGGFCLRQPAHTLSWASTPEWIGIATAGAGRSAAATRGHPARC